MLRVHWRLLVAALIGLIGWLAATALQAPAPARVLIGWNAGALFYLAVAWTIFLTAGEQQVRARAAIQDESRTVILALAMTAVAASMGAIVVALMQIAKLPSDERALVMGLAVLTMASSWFMLQALFTAHYAHRHFQVLDARGPNAAFIFLGDAPSGYLDFAYLAICIGATAQISDPSIGSRPLRNLVTAHSVTAFFYNTAVLALGINILSGLIGH